MKPWRLATSGAVSEGTGQQKPSTYLCATAGSRGILLVMTGERQIDYETLAQDALRSIVRAVLIHVAKSGLPGQHHFYIAFNTNAPGVSVSPRLKERYPEEMTIVLQHRFWDLFVSDERFEVKLTFDAIPERLVVPFAAIRVFFDPSVPYGLQFEGSDLASDMGQDLGAEVGEAAHSQEAEPQVSAARAHKSDVQGSAEPARAEKKPRSPRKPRAAKGGGDASKSRGTQTAVVLGGTAKEARPKGVTPKPDQHDPPANDTKIIQLDKFRKK